MAAQAITKYQTHVEPRFDEIKKWMAEGLAKAEIAKKLQISPWTLDDYIKKYPKLAKIMNRETKWVTNVFPKLQQISEWLQNGDLEEKIYQRLDISHDTWYRYLKEYPELNEIVNSANDIRNKQVENALLKAALGYEYEEVRTIIEEKNGKKNTRIEKAKKFMPPNTGAMQFWLKNKSPEKWNDRRELILDTKDNEEARKQLFLEMIEETNPIEAEYEVVDDNEIEDTDAQ
jgi:transposase